MPSNQIYFDLFKVGNKKIGFDTIVFNEGTARDCPSKKLGLCEFCNVVKGYRKASGKLLCYAAKMEWHKPVLNYRLRQEKYWLNNTAETIAKDIKAILRVTKNKGLKVKYLRINEAHDLKSFEDLQKWFRIAKLLPKLKLYTYTHRWDIVSQLNPAEVPKNFILQTSNFKMLGFNEFRSIKEVPKKAVSCKGNCATCKLCKVNHNKTVYVQEH